MEQVKEEEEEASVASYRIEEHFGWMLHWDKGLQIVAILLHLLSPPPPLTGFSSPISALFLAVLVVVATVLGSVFELQYDNG